MTLRSWIRNLFARPATRPAPARRPPGGLIPPGGRCASGGALASSGAGGGDRAGDEVEAELLHGLSSGGWVSAGEHPLRVSYETT